MTSVRSRNTIVPSQTGFFSDFSFKTQFRLNTLTYERYYELFMHPIKHYLSQTGSYLSLISLTYVVEWMHEKIRSHQSNAMVQEEQSRLSFRLHHHHANRR